MIYDLRRLTHELRTSGRKAIADAFDKLLNVRVTYNPDRQCWFLFVTVPSLRTELSLEVAKAVQALEVDGTPSLTFTRAKYRMTREDVSDEESVFCIHELTEFTAETSSIQSMLMDLAKLDATTADNYVREVQTWLAARWMKTTEGKRTPRLTLSSDISKGYRDGEAAGITSCMSKGNGLTYIKMYDRNAPNIIQIALFRHNGKLAGRTLVWGGKYYDRLYCPTCPSEFERELQANGLRHVGSSDVKFAAVMAIEDDGGYVPYMDTVHWGALVDGKHILVATEEARKSGEIEKKLGVHGISWVDYKVQNGGPFTMVDILSGGKYPRGDMRKLGDLWFSKEYFGTTKSNAEVIGTVRFMDKTLQIPLGDGFPLTDRVTALFKNLFQSIAMFSEISVNKRHVTIGGVIPIQAANGGLMLDRGERLSFVYQDRNSGLHRNIPVAGLEPMGGALSICLDRKELTGYGLPVVNVMDFKTVRGVVPDHWTKHLQRALSNGTPYVPFGANTSGGLGIEGKAGVLLA